MSIREANRLSVIMQIDMKILNLRKTCKELGVSLREAKRIRKRYLLEGEAGLFFNHLSKISPNRIESKVKDAVVKSDRSK